MADCIFCQIVAGSAASWKVHETARAYAFLDINPVSEYHTLVIPKRHATDIFDASPEDLSGVMAALKQVVDLYRERLGIEHVQIVNSSGAEAQQDVFHLHFHIVPRRAGDGQNIKWRTRPEMRAQFQEMLARLR